jgi:hypothetical protein
MINEKTLYNILLLLIIVILIKHISPDLETTIYILKKYLNYIIDYIKRLIYNLFNNNENFIGTTFNGLANFQYKAPHFANSYEKYYIEEFKKNSNVDINKIKKLYLFIDKLITLNVDNNFSTPSNPSPVLFNDIEKNKLSDVLLKKLNSGDFVFSNFKFLKEPIYYHNFNGKDIQPFSFSVDCNQDIGTLNIYIEISIRNDIKVNTEYLVINTIKLLISKHINNDIISNKSRDNLNDLDYDTNIDLNTIENNDILQNNLKKLQTEMHSNYNFSDEVEPININNNINDEFNYLSNDIINNNTDFFSDYNENINYDKNIYSSVEFIK